MNEADAVRKSILSTKLPTTITRRLKGKSRVAVKTIEDLEQHIRIIDHLTYMYQNYHGMSIILAFASLSNYIIL